MEPMNCTVQIRPTARKPGCPRKLRNGRKGHRGSRQAATGKVIVHTTLMGGGFGRRYQGRFRDGSGATGRQVSGKPVMVLWTRKTICSTVSIDRFLSQVAGRVGPNGNLAAWKHFQNLDFDRCQVNEKPEEIQGWASSAAARRYPM